MLPSGLEKYYFKKQGIYFLMVHRRKIWICHEGELLDFFEIPIAEKKRKKKECSRIKSNKWETTGNVISTFASNVCLYSSRLCLRGTFKMKHILSETSTKKIAFIH